MTPRILLKVNRVSPRFMVYNTQPRGGMHWVGARVRVGLAGGGVSVGRAVCVGVEVLVGGRLGTYKVVLA